MAHSMEAFTEWLEAQKGSTLMIQKSELQIGSRIAADEDKVQLQLERIEFKPLADREIKDSYLSDIELVLHGEGTIETDQGPVELPFNLYEIPIQGKASAHMTENGFSIENERAIYSIHVH